MSSATKYVTTYNNRKLIQTFRKTSGCIFWKNHKPNKKFRSQEEARYFIYICKDGNWNQLALLPGETKQSANIIDKNNSCSLGGGGTLL